MEQRTRFQWWRLAVNVSNQRVMRMRPSFFPWSLVYDAYLFEDAMDFDDLQRIIERAGIVEGLGYPFRR
jgi:hypothetical protein